MGLSHPRPQKPCDIPGFRPQCNCRGLPRFTRLSSSFWLLRSASAEGLEHYNSEKPSSSRLQRGFKQHAEASQGACKDVFVVSVG